MVDIVPKVSYSQVSKMAEVRFIEFQSITSKFYANGSQTCVHFSSSTEQCLEPAEPHSLGRQQWQDLCDKLHAVDTLENAERATFLEQIARLALCYAHGEDEDIEAAVKQWQTEILSRDSTTQPKTPTPATSRDKQPLNFDNYYTPGSKKKPESLQAHDVMVRQMLARKIEIDPEKCTYLYVFSDKSTGGVYKVGSGSGLKRATDGWEKCYPEHEVHCFIECPDAKFWEKVVHAELVLYRRRRNCDRCTNKWHGEWFEGELPEILDSVRAWSGYASMLHRHGLVIDRYMQTIPVAGLSSRHDRWRRWAMKETMRWMDKTPRHIGSPVEAEPSKSIDNTNTGDISDSETASTASGPASPSDTPGTTPATTPGSFPTDDDYGLSPTPGARYDTCKPEVPDEDDGRFEDMPQKPLARALFNQPRASSPGSPSIHSNKTEAMPLRRSTGSVSESSTKDTLSRNQIDENIRDILAKKTARTSNPGTIYLTPPHPEKGSYKIYYRTGESRRKRECYSNLAPYLEVKCTAVERIQDLVLAEFDGCIRKDTCGQKGCRTGHLYWINSEGDAISASVRAWADLLETGYDRAQVPAMGFSRDPDRWTKWAQETAEMGKHGRARKLFRRLTDFMKGSDK